MDINELCKVASDNAKAKGFWEEFDEIEKIEDEKLRNMYFNMAVSTKLMLVVGEVSEAVDGLRIGDYSNFKEELADIIIRVCSLAGGLKIDLGSEVDNKVAINSTREYKHGKQF